MLNIQSIPLQNSDTLIFQRVVEAPQVQFQGYKKTKRICLLRTKTTWIFHEFRNNEKRIQNFPIFPEELILLVEWLRSLASWLYLGNPSSLHHPKAKQKVWRGFEWHAFVVEISLATLKKALQIQHSQKMLVS